MTRIGAEVCLRFSIRRDPRNQSCKDFDRPRHLVFGYTRMMMASLLVNPAPTRILVVGLGGGSLPEALALLYPDAQMDLIEIDPAVVRVATRFFEFRPTPNMHIHEVDARVFTKRAGRSDARYDLILLDAFNGDYIPEHLMTQEYLEETRALLAPGGVVAANTFAISDLYDHESVTYEVVFGQFFNFEMPDSANRVVIARAGALPSKQELVARAATLAPALAEFGVPLQAYPRRLSRERNWNTGARVLTDQYAPANLLNTVR
ncbi:MAG: fused MFS/spermidine synthase [Gammaproteobacteria bacterium]|nr:fused MFS/spermidine synthase [Gammaproteobacteria bacterium]